MTSAISCHIGKVYRETDGQMDGQTGRRTELITIYPAVLKGILRSIYYKMNKTSIRSDLKQYLAVKCTDQMLTRETSYQPMLKQRNNMYYKLIKIQVFFSKGGFTTLSRHTQGHRVITAKVTRENLLKPK